MLVFIQDSREDNRKRLVNLNRRSAIAEKCLNCSGFKHSARKNCEFTDCQLFPFRSGKGHQAASVRNKAIRAFCKDFCMEGSSPLVADCSSPDCPLYAFRLSRIDKSVKMAEPVEIEVLNQKFGLNVVAGVCA